MPRYTCAFVLAVLVCFPGPATAQVPAPAASADCLACHGDPSAARADGTTVALDPKVFEASKHGALACVDCHADLARVADFPHPDKLAKVTCATCHDETQASYARGIHAQARVNGKMLAATCLDCHGMHDIKGADDPSSRTHHLQLPGTCARCHGDADIIARGAIQIGDVAAKYRDSIHGRALAKSGLLVAPSCVSCHGSHDIQRRSNGSSEIFRNNITGTCGKCHEGIKHQYDAGVHAAAWQKGNVRAPVCIDCHTAHAIQRADTDAWRLDVTAECGTCHAKVVQSFTRTFHGKVTQLGYARVAACADCHGAHDVRPKSDPDSSISPAHLVETCAKCHDGATARFAQYDPHPDPSDYRRSRVLWWANRFYWVLIPSCFVFFGVHSALWFWRSRREQERAGRTV